MKTAKKALLLVLCGCLLVAVSVFGTMAYFTSQDSVTNTFTVGKVEITLDEAVVDQYGVAQKDQEGNEVRTSEGNKVDPETKNGGYKIIPGHTYVKDPTVTVVGDSEESYIRMLMTINNQAKLDEVFAPNGIALDDIFNGYDSAKWILVGETENGDVRTYEFRYYTTVSTADAAAKPLEPLFEGFTIPETITQDTIGAFEGLEITVVAQAIQADGFTDAADAWSHFAN